MHVFTAINDLVQALVLAGAASPELGIEVDQETYLRLATQLEREFITTTGLCLPHGDFDSIDVYTICGRVNIRPILFAEPATEDERQATANERFIFDADRDCCEPTLLEVILRLAQAPDVAQAIRNRVLDLDQPFRFRSLAIPRPSRFIFPDIDRDLGDSFTAMKYALDDFKNRQPAEFGALPNIDLGFPDPENIDLADFGHEVTLPGIGAGPEVKE